MIYIMLLITIVLIIFLYKRLKNYIEIEFIKQHNGILLDIKKQLDSQDSEIKRLFRELKLSPFDIRSSFEIEEEKVKAKEMLEDMIKNNTN